MIRGGGRAASVRGGRRRVRAGATVTATPSLVVDGSGDAACHRGGQARPATGIPLVVMVVAAALDGCIVVDLGGPRFHLRQQSTVIIVACVDRLNITTTYPTYAHYRDSVPRCIITTAGPKTSHGRPHAHHHIISLQIRRRQTCRIRRQPQAVPARPPRCDSTSRDRDSFTNPLVQRHRSCRALERGHLSQLSSAATAEPSQL